MARKPPAKTQKPTKKAAPKKARKPSKKVATKKPRKPARKAATMTLAATYSIEDISVLISQPAVLEMLRRAGLHNKPPLKWLRQADGSWLECVLLPNGRYGNCHEVDESQVPPEERSK